MSSRERAQKIAGGLLGVHAGDSLGAGVEFETWEQIRRVYPDGPREITGGGTLHWPPGHATDDTDLTRAVLLAYLATAKPVDGVGMVDAVDAAGPVDNGDEAGGWAHPSDVVSAAADLMVAWLHGDWPDRSPGSRPRDIGGATDAGLRRYLASGDPRQAGAGIGAAGNGSLMRCLPTALVVADPKRRRADSVHISAITHDDPRCTLACVAYNEIAAALLTGAEATTAVDIGLASLDPATIDLAARGPASLGPASLDSVSLDSVSVRSAFLDPVALDLACVRAAAEVRAAISLGRRIDLAELARTGEQALPHGGGGFVLDSLSLAVAAVLDPRPLREVLIDVVRLGRDTDSNAAIAGGLLGVRDGLEAIPPQWLAVLQYRDEFLQAANHLS